MEFTVSTMMKAETNRHTIEYLQKISILCAQATLETTSTNSKSSSLASRKVAQHIFANHQQHPGYVPLSMIITGNNIEKKANDVYLPSCQECGNPLQPGYQKTTVVLEEQTQRRNMARRKKRKETTQSNLALYIQTGNQVPKDCLDYLRMTCGICGSVSFVSGTQRIGYSKVKEETHKRQTNSKAKVSKKQKSKDASDDVIELPTIDDSQQPKRKKQKDQGDDQLISQPKKKKKKSKDLLNFLSSLND